MTKRKPIRAWAVFDGDYIRYPFIPETKHDVIDGFVSFLWGHTECPEKRIRDFGYRIRRIRIEVEED